MALFHDIGKVATRSVTPSGVHFYEHEHVGANMAETIMKRLKYPNELINAVKIGVENHMRLKHGGDAAVNLSDKTLRRFVSDVGEQLEHILEVIHADNIAHSEASSMPNQIELVRGRLTNLNTTSKKPALPINGNDLKTELGLSPGPHFSKILSAITEKWFENPNISREEALTIARSMAEK
jgi:tRNA nucleotidyltransferase/poly(A) polymerase